MKASICAKYGSPEVYKVFGAIVSLTDGNFRFGKPYQEQRN